MRDLRFITIGCAAALGLVLSGCGGGSEGGDAAAREVTIAIAAEELAYVNPLNENGSAGIQVSQAMNAPLVQTNPETGELENVVAESVTPDEDNQVWTITLKPGLSFDNGQPLTATDYVESWNMAAQAERGWKNNGSFDKIQGYDEMNPAVEEGEDYPTDLPTELSGLEVVDDLTFTVELKYPFSPYPMTLQYMGITPLAEEVRADPDAYDRSPIGMGPFELAGESWEVGTDLQLTKRADYAGDFAPEADAVTFRFVPNGETAYNDFLAGNLDFVSVPSSKKGSFESDAPGQSMVSESAGNISYLVFPDWVESYSDPRIRQAFSMAINRDTYADLVGLATPASSLVPASIEGSRPDSCGETCSHDVAAAQALLAEAGGFEEPVKIYYSTNSPTGQVNAEAIGNMLRQDLGLEVEYVGQLSSEITEAADSQELDGLRFSGWGHDYPSIENYLTPVLGCGAYANFAGWCNEEFDALVEQGNGETDPEAAIGYYQQAEDIALAELPLVPLHHTNDAYLHSADVMPRSSAYVGVSALYSTFPG